MAKYIYHSEKTKTTCNECSKHDGKIYYDIKDIPQLPIHPNCKCWIETVEDKTDKIECDCKDRMEVLKTNLLNTLENAANMQKSIKSELLECAIYLENPADKDYSSNFQGVQEKLLSLQDKISALVNSAKNLSTDMDTLKESSFDPTYHTKSQCKMTSSLNKYADSTSTLCKKLNDLSEEFKKLKEERKVLSKNAEQQIKKATDPNYMERPLEKLTESIKKKASTTVEDIKTKEGVLLSTKELSYYNIANSPVSLAFPLANTCLQDSMHNFKMANKNNNALILNSRDEAKVINNGREVNNVLVKAGVPKNSRGVYYNPNSSESQNIANSQEIKSFITKNYKNLIDKNIETENLIYFKNSWDLRLALQHCTLVNPRITPDGYFEGTIVDYFDFEELPFEEKDDRLTIYIKDLNNWGFSMQEKGLLENYYLVFSIRAKI